MSDIYIYIFIELFLYFRILMKQIFTMRLVTSLLGIFHLSVCLNQHAVEGIRLNGATSVSRVGGGSSCVLFFTGGSNLFQSSIYNEFIQEMESRDIDVYDVPFQYQISQENIDDLYSKYKYQYSSVNVMGHSSGCTTLLNQCCKLDGIKHVFLLDPVNTKFSKDKWNINGRFESLSFIRAMNSYKITLDPFGLPFIPIFKLTRENLNSDVTGIWELDINNYGHSDILNRPLADFMHNTRLSVGNKKRGVESKREYVDTILSFMETFIED